MIARSASTPAHLRRGDEGFATLFAAFLAIMLCLLAGVSAALGEMVITRQQAGSAADLAALSAADAVLAGASDAQACAAADEAASAALASIVSCRIDGADAVIEVARRAPPSVASLMSAAGHSDGAVHAVARAGPSTT